MNSCASILALLLTLLLAFAPGFVSSSAVRLQPPPSATLLPTITAMPTETINPAALNMDTASLYKSPDGVIEILLPPGWQAPSNVMPGEYQFTSGTPGDESPQFVIVIGRPAEIYKMVLGISGALSPRAALEVFRIRSGMTFPTFVFGDVTPAKLGTLDGYGVAISDQGSVPRKLEVRIATLGDDRVVLVMAESLVSKWQFGKPVIYKMLESLVIRPENIPTATPTGMPITESTATPFPSSTPTLNPAAFDMSTASLYKSPDGAVEIRLPSAWQTEPSQEPVTYTFAYGAPGSEVMQIGIRADRPEEVYHLLHAQMPVESPKAALEAFISYLRSDDSTLEFGEIVPAKIGALDGQGFVVNVPESGRVVEMRIASTENGYIVLAFLWAKPSLWPSAKPVLNKMLDSLVLRPENIPTTTPTPAR